MFAKRFRQTLLGVLLFALGLGPRPALAQRQIIKDYLLFATIGVRADHGAEGMHRDVVTVDIDVPGYYRVWPRVLYNSGDQQKNETFYLTVLEPDSSEATPLDPNAGPYKVVPDDPGPPRIEWRDAGLFYFQKGKSTIKMHHYAAIADQYPQFLQEAMQGPESVKIVDSLRLVAEPRADGALALSVQTLHLEPVHGRKRPLSYPGEELTYKMVVTNRYVNDIRFATLYNLLPDTLRATGFSVDPAAQDGQALQWNIPRLAPGDSFVVTLRANLPDTLLPGFSAILDSAWIHVPNDTDSTNNVASVSSFVLADTGGNKPLALDVSVQLTATGDTTVLRNGALHPATRPGGQLQYALWVTNHGPDYARNFEVVTALPHGFDLQSTSQAPTRSFGDSVFWFVDSLEPDSTFRVILLGRVARNLPAGDSLLVATAWAHAPRDTVPGNDTDQDTVLVFRPQQPLTDVALRLHTQTDSSAVANGDTTRFARPGETYSVSLAAFNNGPASATDVEVRSILPSLSSLKNARPAPQTVREDTIIWTVDSLGVQDTLRFTLNLSVADTLSPGTYTLPFLASVFASNEIPGSEQNNTASDTVTVIARPKLTDLALAQIIRADSFAVAGTDTSWFVRSGNAYTVTLRVTNVGAFPALGVRVVAVPPEQTASLDNIRPVAEVAFPDSVAWSLDSLATGISATFQFDVAVPPDMPVGLNKLVNRATVRATNEPPSAQSDNTCVDTVYNVVRPPNLRPEIQALPGEVDVTDSVVVRVRLPEGTVRWDLWVIRPDGTVDKTFADGFVNSTVPPPGRWEEVPTLYRPGHLISSRKEEKLIFEVHAYSDFGTEGKAQATVLVHSGNYLVLDRNVYRPLLESPLQIRFKLSYRRVARLDIYDLNGKPVVKLTEDVYQGGWNVYPWNGRDAQGREVGSGVYLVTLRSGEFNAWKKFILVR